jgi:U3 small nucleolar RNA-associated protein 13
MTVRSGDNTRLVTGGADSTIQIWADRTREQKESQAAAAEQLVLRQEELSNCLRAKNFRKAVKLAFLLDQPLRMAHIFEQMIVHGMRE